MSNQTDQQTSPVTSMLRSDKSVLPPGSREKLTLDMRTGRDLLFFQERLKQNSLRFKRIRGRWLAGLYVLAIATLACLVRVLGGPAPWPLLGLLIGATIALALQASGIMRRKLWHPQRFAQQCNRSLKQFNMSLAHEGITFNRKIPKHFRDGFVAYEQAYLSALDRRVYNTASTKDAS